MYEPTDDPSRRGRTTRADRASGKLFREDLFEDFWEALSREMNRIRMEYRASLSSAERELEQVRVGIRKVIEEGFAGPALKKDMDELQARKDRLVARHRRHLAASSGGCGGGI